MLSSCGARCRPNSSHATAALVATVPPRTSRTLRSANGTPQPGRASPPVLLHHSSASRLTSRLRLSSTGCDVVPRRRFFASGAASLMEEASEALALAAEAALQRPCGSAAAASTAASASTRLLAAHGSLSPRDRTAWWAQLAVEEEERQLAELSRGLPRGGGRVAPAMLENFQPASPGAPEAAFRGLVAALGAPAGLAGALALRGAVRRAAMEVGGHTPAGTALERLDRRFQAALALWFNPGMLRVERVGPDAAPAVLATVAAAAERATGHAGLSLPRLDDSTSTASWLRCFALRHALMGDAGGEAPPLLIAHASLLPSFPGSLREATRGPAAGSAVTTAEGSKAACLWGLGPGVAGDAADDTEEALRGLGLGQVLLREAAQALSSEAAEVGALVPLRGFASGLRGRRAWEAIPDEQLSLALKRGLGGPGGLPADGNASAVRDVRFVDSDGESVCFRAVEGRGLEVTLGEAAPRRVTRLLVADGGAALRFIMQPGDEGIQVNAPSDVVECGDVERVRELAEACGLLPSGLREPLLRLAYEHLRDTRRPGAHFLWEPALHFHLLGGGALRALHFGADDSPSAVASSLGVMVSFAYDGSDENLRARSEAYLADGTVSTVNASGH